MLGEQGDEIVGETRVQGLVGCEDSVPDGAEDDVGDRAGVRPRRQVASLPCAVGDDGECFPAALKEGSAEPAGEFFVDLSLGHQGAKEVGELRIAGHPIAGFEECPQVGPVAAVIGYGHMEFGLGSACLKEDVGLVAAFFKRLGSFEHLVLAFSPGATGLGPVREISLDDFETAFTGKLFAYIHAIRQAQATESITMISAASARAALPGTVALAAVNGAIERIVSPLAAELAPVRVNAISPGLIDTPWWSFLPDDQRQAQFAAAASSAPAGRIGTAADVAGAVAYLTDASLVTGIILPVDGGITVA